MPGVLFAVCLRDITYDMWLSSDPATRGAPAVAMRLKLSGNFYPLAGVQEFSSGDEHVHPGGASNQRDDLRCASST
jgi:hypothetical protein